MSTPARQVRARPASKPRARTTPSPRPATKKPHQKSHLHAVRSRKRRKPFAFYVMAIAVVGAMVFALAATNVLLAQGAFRMRALALEQQELRQQNGELLLSVRMLSVPNRIAQEAMRDGLVFPNVVEVVHKNGSRELRGPGSGTSKPSTTDDPPKPGGTE